MNQSSFTSRSDLCRTAFPKALVSPLSASLSLALLAALALALFVAPAAMAGATSKRSAADGAAAKVKISKVTVKGAKVSVAGQVTLPKNLPTAIRARAHVALTLTQLSPHKVERFGAKLEDKGRFSASKTTKLTGKLVVAALVEIAGRQSGKQARKRFAGPATLPGKGGGSSGGGGAQGTPLRGLFRLDPGQQLASGKMVGTYFKMLGPSGGGVINADSPFADKSATPLRPGTDGGLSTVEYQPAPSPPFSAAVGGDALANRIVQPQKFFSVDFSIVTDSIARNSTGNGTGAPLEEATPLPIIRNDNGQLSGLVQAWTAAWNGSWFMQGSPKPDGTYAASGGTTPKWNVGGTTPLTGAFDPLTGRFTLTWQSLIVGGAFSGFTGQWHLEGTFLPAP